MEVVGLRKAHPFYWPNRNRLRDVRYVPRPYSMRLDLLMSVGCDSAVHVSEIR